MVGGVIATTDYSDYRDYLLGQRIKTDYTDYSDYEDYLLGQRIKTDYTDCSDYRDYLLGQRIKTDYTDCSDYKDYTFSTSGLFLEHELSEIDHALGTCDALLAKN